MDFGIDLRMVLLRGIEINCFFLEKGRFLKNPTAFASVLRLRARTDVADRANGNVATLLLVPIDCFPTLNFIDNVDKSHIKFPISNLPGSKNCKSFFDFGVQQLQ